MRGSVRGTRTGVTVQICIARALAAYGESGRVERPNERRGARRGKVDGTRSDGTVRCGGYDRHREVISIHERHCANQYQSTHVEPQSTARARTVVIVEILVALQCPFRHRRRRRTLLQRLSVCFGGRGGKERTVPLSGSHWSPPLHPPSRHALGPIIVEEKLQPRRP
jgi:hypothetical protein